MGWRSAAANKWREWDRIPAWLRAALHDRSATLGGAIVLAFLLVALVGPWLVGDPNAFVAAPNDPPSLTHWLGTTGHGQDVLCQTVVGSRVSLLLGLAVGLVVVLLGALVGVTAGYFGGRVDSGLTLLVNIFLVLPGLPLAVVMAAYLPASSWSIAAVLVLTGWAWHARVLRSQALSLRNRDFVAAAIVSGESSVRIIVCELLPNMAPLLVSSFIGATIFAIGAQVGLEFLGLGDLGQVTWGTNLYWATTNSALLTGSWWTFVPTGVCIAVCGCGLTLLNSAIDEATNPRLRARRVWRQHLAQIGAKPKGPSTPVVRQHA